MLPGLLNRSKIERIAVLISYDGTSKFLGAPKIPSSAAEDIAAAVHQLLIQWDIFDRVAAMGFDTTAANSGHKSGACLVLENHLDRKLIRLACRHHIYEIMLRTAFEMKVANTSGPEVLIFNRFADAWDDLDHNSYKSGLEDDVVRSK